MFPWSLNLFWFYPLFSINKTTCCLKCFKLRFPWSKKLLQCSLDPQKCLSLFAIFACLFYLLLIVEEIIIGSRLVLPWSQQSNQEFPSSLKIICQYLPFPKNKFPITLNPREGLIKREQKLRKYPENYNSKRYEMSFST